MVDVAHPAEVRADRQQESHNIQAQVPIVLTLFYPLTRSKGSIGPTAGAAQHSGSGSYGFNPVLSAYNSLKAQLHLLYPYILRYYYSLCTYIAAPTFMNFVPKTTFGSEANSIVLICLKAI